MKKAIMLIVLSLLFVSKVMAIDIKDVDMFGYVRAGVGTNTHGGDQECFYNQGAGGGSGIGRNEFRLANECSNYLELGFRFNHVKSESKNVYTQFKIQTLTPETTLVMMLKRQTSLRPSQKSRDTTINRTATGLVKDFTATRMSTSMTTIILEARMEMGPVWGIFLFLVENSLLPTFVA